MAKYVSVKGWLQCEYSQVEHIKHIIQKHENRTEDGKIVQQEQKRLYNKGWHYPEEIINWTAYIFYGADIKEDCLNFIEEEIKEIVENIEEIEGMFFLDFEEGETTCWHIREDDLKWRE